MAAPFRALSRFSHLGVRTLAVCGSLVIEDEVRMARLLKRALEEEGHVVDVAGDGPDGLWMATENPYAAIVLDVMLPGFDGFELSAAADGGHLGAGSDADRRRPGPRSRRRRG